MPKTPWIMRLPPGWRDRPAWVYLGFLVGIVGLSYAFGFSQSVVSMAIGRWGLLVWGVLLALAGFGVSIATAAGRHALERLTLRILSVCIAVYCGWLLTVVDWRRATMTLLFGVGLVISAEIRAAGLKALFAAAEKRRPSGRQ